MIDFLLTGLSFVLVGLQLRSSVEGLRQDPLPVLLVALAVCLTVIVVRPAWIFTTAWLSHSVRSMLVEHVLTPKPTPRVLAVLSWAGMRGVISLAVALSLPQFTASGEPFPERDLIVFIAFAVILVTLIGQGLTLPLLIRRLGVAGLGVRVEDQEISARLRMARAALGRLDVLAGETGSPPEVVDRVGLFYASRLESLDRQHRLKAASEGVRAAATGIRDGTRELLSRLMDVERGELQEMRNQGIIDGPVARRLQRDLDLLRVQDRG
jgi:CPA1 family monovalent cation:H+ antiporter